MPLQKMQLIAGINKESTNYGNEGGWYDCDKVRFRSGNPEKIGGWTRYSNNQVIGTARHLWNWVDLDNSNWMGVGTSVKYYAEEGGIFNDITPLRATFDHTSTTPTDNCFTTNGTTTVSVHIPSHGAITGDYVTFSGVTATGISAADAAQLNAEFEITYVNGNNFTVTLPSVATTSTTGGGVTIVAEFQIINGLDIYVAGSGWGAGSWPVYVSDTLTNPFTAASTGVQVLNIHHVGHGFVPGSTWVYVYINSIASNPCGIPKAILEKAHNITVIDTNNYSINILSLTSLTTNSTTASGGSVTLSHYVLNTPSLDRTGWGDASETGSIGQQLRLWTAENYGRALVFAARGGDIYYWDGVESGGIEHSGAPYSRAQSLYTEALSAYPTTAANTPSKANAIIASNERFIILFGTESMDGNFYSMLVRWSNQNDPFQWTPSITNQSGEYRLSHGSQIMQAVQTRQETLIFTDSALYSMQYQGPPYVWGFQLLMDNISIISPQSAYTVNGVTYWMGIDKFYMYNGTVATLPCTVKQYVFEDMNYSQAFQFFVGGNSGYNEVWWFYCSEYEQDNAGDAIDSDGNKAWQTGNAPVPNTKINKYVIYNYLDNVWYIGSMARTAWLDSGLRQYPMAADYNGRILNHENGVDDWSGDSAERIYSYITSSEFDISDGQSFGYIWRILPDINFNASNINNPRAYITLYPRRNSGADYDPTKYTTAYNPDTAFSPYAITSRDDYSKQPVYTVQQFDGQVYTRVRARQVMFKLQSTGVGVAWQLGAVRLDVKTDGRR